MKRRGWKRGGFACAAKLRPWAFVLPIGVNKNHCKCNILYLNATLFVKPKSNDGIYNKMLNTLHFLQIKTWWNLKMLNESLVKPPNNPNNIHKIVNFSTTYNNYRNMNYCADLVKNYKIKLLFKSIKCFHYFIVHVYEYGILCMLGGIQRGKGMSIHCLIYSVPFYSIVL